MNSALYTCEVMHDRQRPKRNRFTYRVFMWWIDLDELDTLSRRLWLFSVNRWNLFSLWTRDHLPSPGGRMKSFRDNILAQFAAHGVDTSRIQHVRLLTHLRTFGHLFNPVSFFFGFDAEERPVAALAEVGNTFGERKPFVLGPERLRGRVFVDRQTKYFYVSPFLGHDLQFDFRLAVPDETLALVINTTDSEETVLVATLTGERRALTALRVAGYALRFPLVTLQVITLIHYQAFKLWLKGLPFWRKSEHPELQREVYHA